MTARPVQPSRGLTDLRTLGGLADKRTPTYKAYLRISFLELERTRHLQEIGTAHRRLELMRKRCREIDAETSALLADIGVAAQPTIASSSPADPAPTRPAKPPFRMRY